MTSYDCTDAIRAIPGLTLRDVAGTIETMRARGTPTERVFIKYHTKDGIEEVWIDAKPC